MDSVGNPRREELRARLEAEHEQRKAEFVQKRARVCKFAGAASVEGKVTCEVSFTAMIADAPE